MATTTPKRIDSELKARVIRDILDRSEQTLYLQRFAQAKSLDALARIHRQYEGPNGVAEKLNELQIRVEEECRRRAPGSLEQRLAQEDEAALDNSGGVPIKHVAAAEPAKPPSAGPPIQPAAATSSVLPSPPVSRPSAPAPAPATKPAAKAPHTGGRRRESVEKGVRDRERIVAYVGEHGECRQGDIARALGISTGSIGSFCGQLLAEGKLEDRKTPTGRFFRLAGTPAPEPPAPDPPPERVPDPPAQEPEKAQAISSNGNGNGARPARSQPRSKTEPAAYTYEQAIGLLDAVRAETMAFFDRIEALLKNG